MSKACVGFIYISRGLKTFDLVTFFFPTICCLSVRQEEWQRAAAAADMCLTCTLRLVDVWRQLCRHLSKQSGDGGLVGLASLSHNQHVSSQMSVGVFTPFLSPPSELWYSADLKANNRPFCLSPFSLPPAPPHLLPGAKSYVKHIYF